MRISDWSSDVCSSDLRRVYSLAADPQNPSTLYAGLRAGVFKTADGGKSWRQVSNEVSDAIVAVHPGLTKIIYAAGDDGSRVPSEDGGESWRRVNKCHEDAAAKAQAHHRSQEGSLQPGQTPTPNPQP